MKTTKSQFNEFKKEAMYWIDYFGLKNWYVYFENVELEGNRAECSFDKPNGIACIRLNTEFQVSMDSNEIKLCAFHEVCELMLSELTLMSASLFNNEHVSEKIHDVIRRLENTIFREKRK